MSARRTHTTTGQRAADAPTHTPPVASPASTSHVAAASRAEKRRRASSDHAAADDRQEAASAPTEDDTEERKADAKEMKSPKKAKKTKGNSAAAAASPANSTGVKARQASNDSDGDVEMTDAPPVEPIRSPPQLSEEEQKRDEPPEEEEEEEKSTSAAGASAAAAAAEDEQSGSDDEYDAKRQVDRSGLYLAPPQSATDEVEDPSDPYGSVARRADRMLAQLSPLHPPARMPGLEAQEAELYELLQRTMDASMNNAALILGPRGSGKSALLDLCLRRLKSSWSQQAKSYVLIRLDGSIQTDDTLAMREIVFQVCRDHELVQLKESLDFHAHLAFLVDILNQGHFHDQPIFFVLEEFHLFTGRAKQTLLYNLCDLLQSTRAQICIIGLSSHFDCYERLEKRIRSRMSHRRILLGTGSSVARTMRVDAEGRATESVVQMKVERAKQMEGLHQILKDRLELPARTTKGTATTAAAAVEAKSSRATPASASSSSSASVSPASSYVSAHNASIARLLSPASSPRLHAQLAFHLSYGRTVDFFLRAFRLAVTISLGPRHTHLAEQDVLAAIKMLKRDWTKEALKHCSVLELCLLSSLCSLSRRHLFHQNFSLAYATYRQFHQRQSVGGFVHAVPIYGEAAAFHAWEALLARQHMLVWAETPPAAFGGDADQSYTGRAIQRRFLPVKMMLTEREFAQALKQRFVEAPTWMVQWVTKGDV